MSTTQSGKYPGCDTVWPPSPTPPASEFHFEGRVAMKMTVKSHSRLSGIYLFRLSKGAPLPLVLSELKKGLSLPDPFTAKKWPVMLYTLTSGYWWIDGAKRLLDRRVSLACVANIERFGAACASETRVFITHHCCLLQAPIICETDRQSRTGLAKAVNRMRK